MPTDPRLNSLVQYTQAAANGNPEGGVVALLRAELADQAQRIAALERRATIQTGSGAPTQTVRNGTPYADETSLRLYVRMNGAWRWIGPFT
jgi:hypothetical protein